MFEADWRVLVGLIIIFCVLNITIRKNLKWNCVICLAVFPFIYMFIGAVEAFMNGLSFMGSPGPGGIGDALASIILSIFAWWYIYIPAFILLLYGINNTLKTRSKLKEEKDEELDIDKE